MIIERILLKAGEIGSLSGVFLGFGLPYRRCCL